MKSICIRIRGSVQGVGFRYYTKMKADELGVFGTTQNQSDGSVVTFVNGDEESVKLLIEWCHQGSPASRVDEVKVTELSASETQEFEDFSILR